MNPGSEVASPTPGAASSGFASPPNGSPSEENGAIAPRCSFGPSDDAPTEMVTGIERGQRRANLRGDAFFEAQDRHLDRLVDPERPGWDRSVDDDHPDSRCCELADDLRRRRPGWQKRGRTGDGAVPAGVEEPRQRIRVGNRLNRPRTQGDHRGGDGPGRPDGTTERLLTREENTKAGPQEHVHGRGDATRIGCRYRQGSGYATRRAEASEPRSGSAVVPSGRDHEDVERKRSGGCACKRPVRERRKRLREADERNPGGVVSVTVGVRVDGGLEPREQLVGSTVDRDPAPSIGLPPRHPDREDRRAGSDPMQPTRAIRPGKQPGELGPVTLGPARLGRVLLRARVAPGIDDIDPTSETAVQVRMVPVDTGIEQRDRDAGAVRARDPELGPTTAPRAERLGGRAPRIRSPRRDTTP